MIAGVEVAADQDRQTGRISLDGIDQRGHLAFAIRPVGHAFEMNRHGDEWPSRGFHRRADGAAFADPQLFVAVLEPSRFTRQPKEEGVASAPSTPGSRCRESPSR